MLEYENKPRFCLVSRGHRIVESTDCCVTAVPICTVENIYTGTRKIHKARKTLKRVDKIYRQGVAKLCPRNP